MKSCKFWKIIWVSGIYILLFVILYLVIVYKVKWEHKDLNTYLYFYECNHELCTSTVSQDNYYNRMLCENEICPYINDIIGDNLILEKNKISWIYNYVQGKIVNNKYIEYRYIRDNMFIVSDTDNNYGIIDLEGNIIVDIKYNYIDDYKNEYISFVKDNLYGVMTKNGEEKLKPIYEDIVLINDKIFAGKLNNIYQLHSYTNINDNNSNKYNFVYSVDEIILVANGKKIDILDSNLNSTLLMKIDSFYEYKTGQERDSLNIHSDNKNIYFRVYTNENQFTEYVYNIKNKKLI